MILSLSLSSCNSKKEESTQSDSYSTTISETSEGVSDNEINNDTEENSTNEVVNGLTQQNVESRKVNPTDSNGVTQSASQQNVYPQVNQSVASTTKKETTTNRVTYTTNKVTSTTNATTTKKPLTTSVPTTKVTTTQKVTQNGNVSSGFETEMLRLVNEQRSKNGLSPLTLDNTLSANAALRAREISTQGNFSHTRPDGTQCFTAITVPYRTAGENIAAGQTSVPSVMDSWMNSSGHRANILNSSFTKAGFGCYEVNGRKHWVQFFIG